LKSTLAVCEEFITYRRQSGHAALHLGPADE
jgi:hypothetical protein